MIVTITVEQAAFFEAAPQTPFYRLPMHKTDNPLYIITAFCRHHDILSVKQPIPDLFQDSHTA